MFTRTLAEPSADVPAQFGGLSGVRSRATGP